MNQGDVLAVLAAVVLLGAALVAVLRTDRVRETRQQRLKAVTATAPIGEQPIVSLRRPLRQRGVGRLFSPLAGLWVRLDQSRYQRHFLGAFPDALDLIGRAVRAGLPAVEAMEVAGREIRPPVGIEFQRTLEEVRLGVDINEALQRTAERIRVPDFRFYVVALALQRRTGGALAETLANLSNIIRRRKEMRLKARALSAEAKASAMVLAILPFVVGAILFTLNPALMSILFDDPRGRYMLGLAALSLLTVIAVMALIIKRTLRY